MKKKFSGFLVSPGAMSAYASVMAILVGLLFGFLILLVIPNICKITFIQTLTYTLQEVYCRFISFVRILPTFLIIIRIK